jgi:hypothetical protein
MSGTAAAVNGYDKWDGSRCTWTSSWYIRYTCKNRSILKSQCKVGKFRGSKEAGSDAGHGENQWLGLLSREGGERHCDRSEYKRDIPRELCERQRSSLYIYNFKVSMALPDPIPIITDS